MQQTQQLNSVPTRDRFTGKWGFILSCIGSAVGMGNLWRFPILVSIWGGLTFLIPYFICVILIGATGVTCEFALGRATQGGPIEAFGACSEHRFGKRRLGQVVGGLPILGSVALAIGYTVVMGWIFKYTYLALTGRLYGLGANMDKIGATFGQTASHNALWVLVSALVAFLIMAGGVAKGIEKAHKIMMPVLFVLLVGLAIYLATLPGAQAGYRYIFTFDSSRIWDPMLWLFAFGQAFFSLSIAGNGSVIYGSYLPQNEDLPASARNVALFDTLAALLAAFVILPAMATSGAALNQGGPGLLFIHLVHVLNSMPGGLFLGILFYVCVLCAGVSSLINLYEAPVATLQANFRLGRLPATALVLALSGTVACFIQAIVEGWMNVVSIYICPLGALLAAVFFCWIAGKDFVAQAVNPGRAKPLAAWYYPLTKYVYCALCLLALIAGAIVGGIG